MTSRSVLLPRRWKISSGRKSLATVVNTLGAIKSDDYNLNVIQINLHNSAMAMEELVEFAVRNSIDMALVQEPYVGEKFKLPSSIQVFNLSRTGSRSAILIFNSRIKGVLFGDLTNELVTVVKISTTSEMTVVSVYSPPGGTASASRSNLSAVLFTIRHPDGKWIFASVSFGRF